LTSWFWFGRKLGSGKRTSEFRQAAEKAGAKKVLTRFGSSGIKVDRCDAGRKGRRKIV